MAKLRKGWEWIGHAFTAQSLYYLILPLLGVGVLAVCLAWFTAFVSLFAPLSYLLAALIAIILGSFALSGVASLAKQLGWASKPRTKRLPTRDAELAQVVKYVARESEWGIATVTGETKVRDIALELMDKVVERELTVWGRVGDFHIEPIRLDSGVFDLSEGTLKRVTEWGTIDYKDVQLNWRQVRRAWPKPGIWRRMLMRMPSAEV